MKYYYEVVRDINFIQKLAAEGYKFTDCEDQKLKTLDGGDLHKMGQSEFEQLGELVIGSVQQMMKENYHMEEVWLPESDKPVAKCNIFISDDFYSNTDRCLILIQGTGAVRAG